MQEIQLLLACFTPPLFVRLGCRFYHTGCVQSHRALVPNGCGSPLEPARSASGPGYACLSRHAVLVRWHCRRDRLSGPAKPHERGTVSGRAFSFASDPGGAHRRLGVGYTVSAESIPPHCGRLRELVIG
jgi:hypothetical protein